MLLWFHLVCFLFISGYVVDSTVTRCLHFTADCTLCTTGCMNTVGCTTGWMNYANESNQAVLERSSQDAYDVIRLTCSRWTVDGVARVVKIFFKKSSYLFITLSNI